MKIEAFKIGDYVVANDFDDLFVEGYIIEMTNNRVLIRNVNRCSIFESYLAFITKDYYSEEDIIDYKTGVTQMKIASSVGAEFTLELTELIERITSRCVKEINELRTRKGEYQNQSELSNFTYEQSIAYTEIQNWILSTTPDSLLKRLVGYAGTGKTYTISRCIQGLPVEAPLKILLCSPTNKALKVLKGNFESANNNSLIEYQFLTIAQTLGKQPVENNQKMEEEFLTINPKELDKYQVIIVDEYSMINQENLEDLLIKYGGKVLFVGDNAQLAPINEKSPPVDDLEEFINGDNTWRLTEVVRYSGQVGLLAYELRDSSPRKINRADFSGDDTLIWLQGRDGVKRTLKAASNRFSEDPNSFRILAHKNKTCADYNEQFRLYLWGLHADDCPYHVGERLIAKSPVYRGAADIGKVKILNNSDEFTLEKPATLKEAMASEILPDYTNILGRLDKYKWKYWSLPYGFHSLRVIDEEMTGEYQKLLKKLQSSKDKIDRQAFWRLKSEVFDNIGYAYALTTHKAQGSTFDSVLILWDELQARYLDNTESRRLTYTAITRCKSCAYCLV
ncbi:AAA family ATPase [Roseofilum reptotaenium CS-1145]|uniref:UvrD-like helicase C-terminal domain-containing protein n=1 Tax=Roseofilum reptotaenium AO1-A TaxID=1925591 RepID=A0A1L9QKL1_9CYAN|nr:AAA family ATPase [Roseofilum reptotaenium]MDB9515495.1 AAA family ATPase [Roseofilum reptotaenium CS-1145]OJJ16932.1 hypothetical protein BI308_23235 [Roseofilum reptotaenium AO1-A]